MDIGKWYAFSRISLSLGTDPFVVTTGEGKNGWFSSVTDGVIHYQINSEIPFPESRLWKIFIAKFV